MHKSLHRKRLDEIKRLNRYASMLDTTSSTFAVSSIGLLGSALLLMILSLIPSTLDVVTQVGICILTLGILSLLADMLSQRINNLADKWERESKRVLRNRKV